MGRSRSPSNRKHKHRKQSDKQSSKRFVIEFLFYIIIIILFHRSRHESSESSASSSPDDSTLRANISELTDLIARKKAEVDRLAELERERMQIL